MKDKPDAPRRFHMHETSRMLALEGLPLAAFWQRLLGFFADLLLAVLLWIPLEFSLRRYLLHQNELDLTWNFHEPGNIVVMVLYWSAAASEAASEAAEAAEASATAPAAL